jgi:hypothetical protein
VNRSPAQTSRQDGAHRGPRRRGRPTRFTDETREALLGALRVGATRKAACAKVGLAYSTFMSWMQQAAAGDAEHEQFALQVEQAEATVVAIVSQGWALAARRNWRAAMALLERRHPNDWAPRKVFEHRYHGPPGTTPVVKVYELPESGVNYRAMLRAAKAGDEAEWIRMGGKIRTVTDGDPMRW